MSIGLFAGLCLLILAGLAIYPNYLRSRGTFDPETPLSDLRTLSVALITYSIEHDGNFPKSLEELGPAKAGNSHREGLIDGALASGTKVDYRFSYVPEVKKGSRIASFTLQADPLEEKTPELPHYFTDQTGVVRTENGHPASAQSPQLTY
jgi:hypothetical protein